MNDLFLWKFTMFSVSFFCLFVFSHNSTCNSIHTPLIHPFHLQLGSEIQLYGLFPCLSTFFYTFQKLAETKNKPSLSLKDSDHHKHCCSSLVNSELCLLSLTTWSFKSDWAVSSSRLKDFTNAVCFLPDWADLNLSICTVPFQLPKQTKLFRFYMMPRPWEDTFLTVDQPTEDLVWHLQDHPSKISIRAPNSSGGQPFSSRQNSCTSGSR